MMVPVGLVGGMAAVSDMTSSPTLVIFIGVRESRLSPSELELSLDSRLFPRLRGVANSDSRSFGASVRVWREGRGVCWQVQAALSPAPPLGSPVPPMCFLASFGGLIGDWQPYRNVNKLLADHRHVASVSEALL